MKTRKFLSALLAILVLVTMASPFFTLCLSASSLAPEAESIPLEVRVAPTMETIATEPPEAQETTVLTEPVTEAPTEELTEEPTEEQTEALTEEVVVEGTEPETKPETEPKVEETQFKSYYHYEEWEADLLARLISAEGETESYSTKLKIGSVVMNRVVSNDFPNTIYGVIYQKSQFSVTTTKINGVIMIDRPASEESKRAAREVLDYGSVLPSSVQVFYASYCKEGWVTSRAKYGQFDNTVFAHIYRG